MSRPHEFYENCMYPDLNTCIPSGLTSLSYSGLFDLLCKRCNATPAANPNIIADLNIVADPNIIANPNIIADPNDNS